MKILHVIGFLHTGGAERLMTELLPRMRDAGHEVALLVFDSSPTPFRKQLEQAGIKVIDSVKSKSVYDPRHILRLRRIARDYDVVHTHTASCQLFGAIAVDKRDTLLITTEHNTHNRRRRWRWYRAIDRWMYERYDSIILISEGVRRHLENYLPSLQTPMEVIHNGIDVKHFREAQPSYDQIPKDTSIVKVLMVAVFHRKKDHATTIRAMRQLPANIHLYFAGDGPTLPASRRLATDLGVTDRVHFLGDCNDVASLWKAADIGLLSSHYEGFGLAAVEAMAAGVPVIASDVDGLHDVVEGAGILFPPHDESRLAEAILSLAENPEKRREIVEAGKRRASDFDISRMTRGYLNISAVNKNPREH